MPASCLRNRPPELALLILLAALIGCARGDRQPPPTPWPSAVADGALFDFGQVVRGTEVEHRFLVRNGGLEDLVLDEREVATHLSLGEFERLVPPGGSVEIPVALESSGLSGSGELRVLLATNDPERPELSLRLKGRVVQPVEVEPGDRIYFLDLPRGATAAKQVRLVNHRPGPLQILAVTAGRPRYFDTELETVEAGREYLLTVRTALPDAAGTFEETISISTDSAESPAITLRVVARVLSTVDVKPAALAFSRFYLDDLGSEVLSTKRLRVQKPGATDFAIVGVTSDVPSLDFEIEVEKAGESYIVVARIAPERVRKGVLEGTLRIETNDPDFPELALPISGEIL